MKQVVFSKKFTKHYRLRIKPSAKLLKQYDERYLLFCKGARDKLLNDHPLTHHMAGLRAFSVTGDVRVIYRETGTTYEFVDVGSHNQVY